MGILNDLLGSPEEDAKAQERLEQMRRRAAELQAPSIAPVQLAKQEYQGDYHPQSNVVAPQISSPVPVAAQQAQVAQSGPSLMQGVATDPRLRDAQMQALSSLQAIGTNGGMTAQDRAQLSQIQADNNQADRGRRDAILQNMSARGMGGSGNELLAQLQSSQAATDRQSQEGLNVAGMAQQRALQALQGAGAMAGNIQGQDFSQKSDVARASDAINQFNTQNKQQGSQFNASQGNNMGQFNAGQTQRTSEFNAGNTLQAGLHNSTMNNNAGMAGWQARQGVADNNTATANKQTMVNQVDLPQQNFNNNMGVTAAQNNVDKAGADYWQGAGDREAKLKGAVLQGGIMAGTAAFTKSDERTKKDISPISDDDIQTFLKAVKPKTFKYKDSSEGTLPGKRIGFIMQDVADTKVGKAIQGPKVDGMMTYDKDNLQGVLLSALSSLAKKNSKDD